MTSRRTAWGSCPHGLGDYKFRVSACVLQACNWTDVCTDGAVTPACDGRCRANVFPAFWNSAFVLDAAFARGVEGNWMLCPELALAVSSVAELAARAVGSVPQAAPATPARRRLRQAAAGDIDAIIAQVPLLRGGSSCRMRVGSSRRVGSYAQFQ